MVYLHQEWLYGESRLTDNNTWYSLGWLCTTYGRVDDWSLKRAVDTSTSWQCVLELTLRNITWYTWDRPGVASLSYSSWLLTVHSILVKYYNWPSIDSMTTHAVPFFMYCHTFAAADDKLRDSMYQVRKPSLCTIFIVLENLGVSMLSLFFFPSCLFTLKRKICHLHLVKRHFSLRKAEMSVLMRMKFLSRCLPNDLGFVAMRPLSFRIPCWLFAILWLWW